MSGKPPVPHGRGAVSNPPNRFESIRLERDADWDPEQDPAPTTQFLRDSSQSAITYNDSPDVPFNASLNPYRGCEHGCSYCFARPTHEYLGLSSGLDFETKILVKTNAPELLRKELGSPKWKPQILGMSGVTDAYQPVERRFQLARQCLAVLAEFRNPVAIVTKNFLVTRDSDHLGELARYGAVAVSLSINSLDSRLARQLEPRASSPAQRLAAVKALKKSGVPAGVIVAPIIPGLNDHEVPRVIAAAGQAGAQWAWMEILRLPLSVAGLFQDWLDRNTPERKEKVLHRLRAMRGGKLNDARFGVRMTGEGQMAGQIAQMFQVACRRAGLSTEGPSLSTAAFRRPAGDQMELPLC